MWPVVVEKVFVTESRIGVRGDRHMRPLIQALTDRLVKVGVPVSWIKQDQYLQGFFRPRKSWDLVVSEPHTGWLMIAIELKGAFRSIGKNFNNRCEEVLGSATDLRASVSSGKITTFGKDPFVGYVILTPEHHSKYHTMVERLELSGLYTKASMVTRNSQASCKRMEDFTNNLLEHAQDSMGHWRAARVLKSLSSTK